MVDADQAFPKFYVQVLGVNWFLSKQEVEELRSVDESFGIIGIVLEKDDSVRDISPEERQILAKIFSEKVVKPERSQPGGQFPKFLMITDRTQREFLSIGRAGAAYDCGWCRVEIGDLVLLSNFTTRPTTKEDRAAISDVADEYSASK